MTAPDFLTTSQVAQLLACSDQSVLRAINRGDLKALKYGRLVRIARSDVDAFIERFTTQGPQPTRRRGRR